MTIMVWHTALTGGERARTPLRMLLGLTVEQTSHVRTRDDCRSSGARAHSTRMFPIVCSNGQEGFLFFFSFLFAKQQRKDRYAVYSGTMSYTWIFACLSLLFILLWKASQVGSRPPGCPPGPPTLPLIGNLHQMPLKDGFLQFQKWAKEYGYA